MLRPCFWASSFQILYVEGTIKQAIGCKLLGTVLGTIEKISQKPQMVSLVKKLTICFIWCR